MPLNVAGSSNGIICVAFGKELAVRDVLIDLDGVLVDDRIVIACQYQGGCRDGFERLDLNVRLLEHHADHLELALAARCVAIGSGDRRHRLPD